MRERLSGAKKADRFTEPEDYRPRGATTDATPPPKFDSCIALPPRGRYRKGLAPMPMRRADSKSGYECLITQQNQQPVGLWSSIAKSKPGEAGDKWAAAVTLQPTIPNSDRLLARILHKFA
ncbi:MAG: hypothetical protein Q8O33_11510 [Pseudomonadota bacterium]|nr:hypothetical protein [Pseudomonadota bacterium]